jgi:hypothetical protein
MTISLQSECATSNHQCAVTRHCRHRRSGRRNCREVSARRDSQSGYVVGVVAGACHASVDGRRLRRHPGLGGRIKIPLGRTAPDLRNWEDERSGRSQPSAPSRCRRFACPDGSDQIGRNLKCCLGHDLNAVSRWIRFPNHVVVVLDEGRKGRTTAPLPTGWSIPGVTHRSISF